MQIPAYQIHNVLKAYSRQVSQNKLNSASRSNNHNTPMDKISISAEGKKQGVIDKVAADIVQKITKNDPHEKIEKDLVDKLELELRQKMNLSESTEKDFSYYEINGNSKRKNTFSFNELDNVKKKMEDLANDLLTGNTDQKGEEK
ncbi:MAG: hypothetical protein H6681_00110 [Desulfobacteraceae bacterium]|nr:hypothetical protein [Desulfobacteraceae bacterium]